jgi:hypothetical protein
MGNLFSLWMMLRRKGEVSGSGGIRFVDSRRTCSTMNVRTGIFSNLDQILGFIALKTEHTHRETDAGETEWKS